MEKAKDLLPETVFQRAMLGAFLLAVIYALVMPAAAFSVDESLYIEMARAFAENFSLGLITDGALENGPALLRRFTFEVDGQVVPQYPGAYGILAAPFYALFGIRGLILMNTAAAAVTVLFTYRLAMRLYQNADIARLSAMLLVFASFLSTYAFGIWPHAVALMFLIIAAERLAAAFENDERLNWRAVFVSGLSAGAAFTLRVDSILIMLALFIWVRCFAAPNNRHAAVVFLAGLTPGLAVAALINGLKFDVWSPFAYGPADAGLQQRYTQGLALTAIVCAAICSVPFDQPFVQRGAAWLRSRNGLLTAGSLLLAAVLLIPMTRQYLWNIYVLVFDLQQLDPERYQPGVVALENGFVSFWGVLKPALLQSLPWAALTLYAIIAFVKGEQARSHALLFGLIAAPIAFYALNQWHAGFSLTMRYFLPAVPALALLAAVALTELRIISAFGSDKFRLCLISGIFAALLFPVVLGSAVTLEMAVKVYAPIILTTSLGAAIFAQNSQRLSRFSSFSAVFAALSIGWSAAASLSDIQKLHSRLDLHTEISAALAERIESGSLTLTTTEEWFVSTRSNDVQLANPQQMPNVGDAIAAYRNAGRCVYWLDTFTTTIKDVPALADFVVTDLPGAPESFPNLLQPEEQAGAC